ncbi:MAG: PQQ-binding-like beta-propeller repeat protein, partial [Bacteroidales bacterium]|nr:PQQ-binding-like beta-propeller repeat protein [Bacteroidales bacterium]
MIFKKLSLVIAFLYSFAAFSQEADSIQIIVKTFRGNEQRNYYGENAPKRLRLIWKISLGSGKSVVKDVPRIWTGAGWTGQPLLFLEKGKPYLIQGAYDYNLRKIDAKTGKVAWAYKFDDIIKGTGTIWENPDPDLPENRFVIMQGSRYGAKNDWEAKVIPSFRGISLITGKELWRMNVKQTYSYSRDVDGSAIVVNDTAYIGLENGIFTVFNPDNKYAQLKDDILQPKIYRENRLFNDSDVLLHGVNFVTEASPTLIGNKIVIGACSRVYAYNLDTKKFDWNFYVATDIDGTTVVTDDNKVLVTLERQ